MKYAIFGFALAFSLGASAQTASPGAADSSTGGTDSGTQAASPGTIDTSSTANAAQAAGPGAPEVNAAPTSVAQTSGPNAADVNAAPHASVAQAADPGAPDAGSTGSAAQAASPNSATGSAAQTVNPADVNAAPAARVAQAADSSAPEAGSTGSAAQAASPNSATGSVAQTADPKPAGANTATTASVAQAASPNAIDLHAGATGGETSSATPIALEVHAGSSGAGGQAELFFNDYLAVRVSGDWLRVSASFNEVDLNTVDIHYAGTANWTTVGAFIDVHPFRNGWFVSGGAYQGARNASFAGAPTSDVIIDGITFTPADVGTVMGVAKLPSTSPFVGLGWDEAQYDRSGLTFRFLGGAAFGSAKVHLWDVGPYSDTAPMQQWLAMEQAQAQTYADPWKAYPVVQVGIGYRF